MAAMRFRQQSGAWLNQLNARDGNGAQPVEGQRDHVCFLLRLEELWTGGPGFVGAFGHWRGNSIFTTASGFAILQQWALLSVVTLALGSLLIIGEFDISVGSVVALGGIGVTIYARLDAWKRGRR